MIFADEKYDSEYQGEPKLSYMICGARRSGTTYLGKLLWDTGVLGKPFEYQLPECRQLITQRLPDNVSYWDFLKRTRTTANGVFGFKEVAPVTYRMKNLVANKVIYVDRYDEVAQSVSLTLAMQTTAFFHFQKSVREPEYNYDAILNNFIHLIEVKSEWEELLAAEKREILRLHYEDLNPAVAYEVADFLGIELVTKDIIAPPMIRQACEINKDWCERFRHELEMNNCSAQTAEERRSLNQRRA